MMHPHAAKAFVASATFDGRLRALEERCSGDRLMAHSGRGIEQMVQELRQQARYSGAYHQRGVCSHEHLLVALRRETSSCATNAPA